VCTCVRAIAGVCVRGLRSVERNEAKISLLNYTNAHKHRHTVTKTSLVYACIHKHMKNLACGTFSLTKHLVCGAFNFTGWVATGAPDLPNTWRMRGRPGWILLLPTHSMHLFSRLFPNHMLFSFKILGALNGRLSPIECLRLWRSRSHDA